MSILCDGQENVLAFNGSSISLKGEWNLVMDTFLDYEGVKKDTLAIKAWVPGTWNQLIWNGERIGAYGYGTYYRQVIIDSSVKEKTLALEVSEVSLAYTLYVNNSFIGSIGTPGKNSLEERPRMDYEIFDFKVVSGDTITLIYHVSNFSHESGGLWYAPNMDTKQSLQRKETINQSIKFIILGCILIGALFQLSIFLQRPLEKFGLYFFLVCLSLAMLLMTRGNMPLMDLFPDTSWITLKKTLYLSIFLIGPSNALFLRELFPKFINKYIVNGMAILAIALCLFTLVVSPRISYNLIPIHHIYNIFIGIYLFVSIVRAALADKYGARFLMIGYLAAFMAVLHDILSSQYIIEGYSFSMIFVGIFLYIIQLMFLLSGRYLSALKGKEQLSNHLKEVNKNLEEIVEKRTKALSEKNKIIEIKNAELKKAMKEKDHLMAVVAHDLKAPLSNIQGISDLMQPNLKGKSAKFNEMIKKVTSDGRKLIEDFTELKVLEQKDFKPSISNFRAGSLIREKVLVFDKMASEKNIVIKATLPKEDPEVKSDSAILGRILDNLLSNAIKFSQQGNAINIQLKTDENNLIIRIKDYGPGFSIEDKKLVFQKFQRLSARPTAGESSTGLGLSIVKTLVENLNGKIELISEPNEGAEFIITIPSQLD